MKTSISKSDLKNISEISKIIKQSKTFFIAGHIKPDGDCLGSALALCSALRRMGKKADVYCSGKVPAGLEFMSGANNIKYKAGKNDVFDCAIILECINFSRMGDIIEPRQAKKVINIDHHSMFTSFGDANYIVPSSSSTAELILNIFEFMKIKPAKEEAENLYVGIVTDTGRFQQLNTTAGSHIAAAKLIDAGVMPNEIAKKAYDSNSLGSVKLLGFALSDIKTLFGGQLAYIFLTDKMFKESGACEDETEGIINFTMSIKGVKVGCLFKKTAKGETKISFRSVRDFDVLEVVRQCGGGGHKNAAGCTVKKNMQASLEFIKEAFKEKLDAKPRKTSK